MDANAGKVAHANHIPESYRARGLDARTWASKVTAVIGGKVSINMCVSRSIFTPLSLQAGGKEEGAQGVGQEVSKVEDAVIAAKKYLDEVKA